MWNQIALSFSLHFLLNACFFLSWSGLGPEHTQGQSITKQWGHTFREDAQKIHCLWFADRTARPNGRFFPVLVHTSRCSWLNMGPSRIEASPLRSICGHSHRYRADQKLRFIAAARHRENVVPYSSVQEKVRIHTFTPRKSWKPVSILGNANPLIWEFYIHRSGQGWRNCSFN